MFLLSADTKSKVDTTTTSSSLCRCPGLTHRQCCHPTKWTPWAAIATGCELQFSAFECAMMCNSGWPTPNWCNKASGWHCGRCHGWGCRQTWVRVGTFLFGHYGRRLWQYFLTVLTLYCINMQCGSVAHSATLPLTVSLPATTTGYHML